MKRVARALLGLFAAATLVHSSSASAADSPSLGGYSASASSSGLHAFYNPEGVLPLPPPVDIGSPDGRQIFHELIKAADVFLTSYREPARRQLKIEVDAWGFIDTPEARKRVVRSHDLNTAGMLGSTGQAAQCVRAGNWVFLQGQVGWTLEGELVAVGDAAGQARQAMENIQALMELAGGSLSDVVRVVVYVTDRAVRDAAYPVIRRLWGDVWPCGTGVVVKGLARPEMLIEIDAYGFIDDPE